MTTGVGGLFGPRPRPLTMRVRERGRGPNRKEGWWWTGEGFGGLGWVQEKKRQKRKRRETATAAADAGVAAGKRSRWGTWRSGMGRERASECGRDAGGVRGERAESAVACAAAVSDAASAAMASSPRQTAAAIVRTRHGAPLSPCMDRGQSGVAAASSRMQERDGPRSRAARLSDLLCVRPRRLLSCQSGSRSPKWILRARRALVQCVGASSTCASARWIAR